MRAAAKVSRSVGEVEAHLVRAGQRLADGLAVAHPHQLVVGARLEAGGEPELGTRAVSRGCRCRPSGSEPPPVERRRRSVNRTLHDQPVGSVVDAPRRGCRSATRWRRRGRCTSPARRAPRCRERACRRGRQRRARWQMVLSFISPPGRWVCLFRLLGCPDGCNRAAVNRPHGQAQRAADERHRAHPGGPSATQARHPTRQRLERDRPLELGDRSAHAAVDAARERQVVEDVRAGDVEGGRIAEDARVAVGAADQQVDPLPTADGLAGDLGVVEGDASGALDRRVEAQRLLDRCAHERRVGDQCGPLVGVVEQRVDGVAEQVDGRLETRRSAASGTAGPARRRGSRVSPSPSAARSALIRSSPGSARRRSMTSSKSARHAPSPPP